MQLAGAGKALQGADPQPHQVWFAVGVRKEIQHGWRWDTAGMEAGALLWQSGHL